MPDHSEAFKADAVRRYRENPGVPLHLFALGLGIGPSTFREWLAEAREDRRPATETRVNEIHDSTVHHLFQAQTIEQVNIINREDPRTLSWPLLLGQLPPLAADRQERDVDGDLSEALTGGGTAVVCQVLSGMGGVGKTQVAAAYAHRQWGASNLDLLVWVNSTSRESIVEAFADAAVAVCGAVPGASGPNAEVFLAWLALPEGERWLIVLDDLADPNDLKELWPPSNPFGRTVVTTRRRDAALVGEGRHRVDVDLFTAAESEQYLSERLGGNPARLVGAQRLAESLGHLPLALAQAAAYILDQPGLTCEGYGELFDNRAIRLAQLSPDSLPDGHRRTVAATWSLSIERADSYEPTGAATSVLRLACHLDPNAIPLGLFTGRTARRFVFGSRDEEEEGVLRRHKIKSTLGRMHRLSLLDFDGEHVRVHALVQRAVFDDLDPAVHARAAICAADAIGEIWPDTETTLADTSVLRSNIDYLQRRSEEALFARGVHPALVRVGHSLIAHGQVSAASTYFGDLHRTGVDRLSADHPQVLDVGHAHAVALGAAGDGDGALAAFEDIVERRSRVLGPEHPDTRAVVRDLEWWQNAAVSAIPSSGLRNSYRG